MINIPVMRPQLANFEEIAILLRRIDQSHIYSNRGPLVRELEEEYSRYFNVEKKLVVALANATQAIQGLISISKNENWIVPDYTFSATGLAVLNANRSIYICDVDLFNWKLDLNLIPKEWRGFGIIPVMPFGAKIEFNLYQDFEDVIIDAAASLGAAPPAFTEMKDSWSVVYSLHATKVLGAGEGSIVVCGNEAQAELLRAWSNFGFSTDRTSDIQGTNAKMSEVSAAYGIHSIQNRIQESGEWLKSQEIVSTKSKNRPWTTFVNSLPQFHPYWIVSFKNKQEKSLVVEKLEEAKVQTREWWAKPLSLQSAFSESSSSMLNGTARQLSEVHLGLPMYRGLSPQDIERICDVIDSAISN
jgi:dTDP-4-amino-4,6-dideoxygalactose transaminase